MQRFFHYFDYAIAAFVVIMVGRFVWKRRRRSVGRKIS
jgi:hypothetical protein